MSICHLKIVLWRSHSSCLFTYKWWIHLNNMVMWLQGQLELSSWIYYMLPKMERDSHINANIISFVLSMMLESIIHSADVELECRIFVSYFPVCLVATFQLNLDFFLNIWLTYVMFCRKDTSKVYLSPFHKLDN